MKERLRREPGRGAKVVVRIVEIPVVEVELAVVEIEVQSVRPTSGIVRIIVFVRLCHRSFKFFLLETRQFITPEFYLATPAM